MCRKEEHLTQEHRTLLTELAEDIQKLASEPSLFDRDSWDSWQDRYMLLQMRISHEELLQFTRIANTLQAMQLTSIAELVGLQRQIDALTLKLDSLTVIVDENFVQPVERLKREVEQLTVTPVDSTGTEQPLWG